MILPTSQDRRTNTTSHNKNIFIKIIFSIRKFKDMNHEQQPRQMAPQRNGHGVVICHKFNSNVHKHSSRIPSDATKQHTIAPMCTKSR